MSQAHTTFFNSGSVYQSSYQECPECKKGFYGWERHVCPGSGSRSSVSGEHKDRVRVVMGETGEIVKCLFCLKPVGKLQKQDHISEECTVRREFILGTAWCKVCKIDLTDNEEPWKHKYDCIPPEFPCETCCLPLTVEQRRKHQCCAYMDASMNPRCRICQKDISSEERPWNHPAICVYFSSCRLCRKPYTAEEKKGEHVCGIMLTPHGETLCKTCLRSVGYMSEPWRHSCNGNVRRWRERENCRFCLRVVRSDLETHYRVCSLARASRERDEVKTQSAEQKQPPRTRSKRKSSNTTLSRVKDEETEDEKEACKICMTNKIRTAFVPCGHAVACLSCSKVVEKCPVCRGEIQEKIPFIMC